MEAKVRALENLLKVIAYLKPENETLARPMLCHPDLHSDNIFINEEDQTKMTGIID